MLFLNYRLFVAVGVGGVAADGDGDFDAAWLYFSLRCLPYAWRRIRAQAGTVLVCIDVFLVDFVILCSGRCDDDDDDYVDDTTIVAAAEGVV